MQCSIQFACTWIISHKMRISINVPSFPVYSINEHPTEYLGSLIQPTCSQSAHQYWCDTYCPHKRVPSVHASVDSFKFQIVRNGFFLLCDDIFGLLLIMSVSNVIVGQLSLTPSMYLERRWWHPTLTSIYHRQMLMIDCLSTY